MRQCTWCGNKGWFLSLSREGLCQKCDGTVKVRIVTSMRALNEHLAAMRRSRDLDVRLTRSQDAIRHLRELIPFYEKGLLSLNPSPQEWVARMYVTERKFAQEYIEGMLKAVGTDAGDPGSDRPPKVEQLNRVIEAIETYRVQLGEANAQMLRQRVEQSLSGFLLESAEKDSTKGHRERALDQYIEALDMMRADKDLHADQRKRIESIKTRIRDLGGHVPKRWEEVEGD
jgi:hypothetical protein